MSKMDRQLNSKKDKETIYEIYRACRLCGAGAGYKMPIIQNVIDVDDTEVELKQKVRECVQIEVHQDDKMPPLICELCVDKVNDFYEFLEMCRQTNKRTRLRLGLPPQSMPKGAPDAGECILGLTEPVYVNEDSDGEQPLSKQKKVNPKVKVKREPELKVKLEKEILTEVRTTRLTKRSPTPPRVTRHRTSSKEDNVSLSRLKDKPKPSPKSAPKSILKKESKNEGSSLLTPRLKRSRDKEPVKLDTPNKRVKIAPKPSPATPSPSPVSSARARPALKPPKVAPRRAPSPPRLHKCAVCGQAFKTVQANTNHTKTHTVGFTSPKVACNPCGLWFSSPEEAAAHHKYHRNKSKPYECRRCYGEFKYLSGYDEHFDSQCIPIREVPDVKCDVCWHLFATSKLLEDHKCLGEDHRPGGKCNKCRKSYALLKNLKKHEQTCTAKKKGESTVDPVLLRKVKPIQIRVSRCDPLLTNLKQEQEHYDVSNVTADFGLDKNCVYPYIASYSRLRIKSDPDGMVDINPEIKDEFYAEEDYVHWDSEDSGSDDERSCSSPSLVLNPCTKKSKKLESLANLSLRTIFSKRCLGKVPKKRRKVKHEKMFDSLLAGTEDDVTRDINKIIDNMGDDDDDQFNEPSQKDEVNDSDKSMDVSADKVVDDVISDKDEDNDKSNDDGNSVGNSLEITEKDNAQNDYVLSEGNDQSDENSRKNFNSVSNDSNGSNNNISSNNDYKINNGINSLSFDYFDGDIVRKNDDRTNDGRKNDDLKIDYESQDSISIGAVSESLLNDNTQSDVSENDKVDKISNDIDNATSLPEQNSDVDENKSQSNEFSVDLSQDSKLSELEAKTNDSSQRSEVQADESEGSENVTDTDYNNAISVIVKSKATGSEEIDDSKLMEALDAQIGNSNENSRDQMNSRSQGSENFNEKIGLDIITDKSSELDGYQDFNFDA